jgi:hypothetical protein
MLRVFRSIAARVMAIFGTAQLAAPTYRYNGPAIPVVTRRQRAVLALHALGQSLDDHPHHYPELQCRGGRKTKGRRDQSLKIRSNRRKAKG